jgi:competence protein ComFC
MGERCLICEGDLGTSFTWKDLFAFHQEQICTNCQEKLERIQGEVCQKCSRPKELVSSSYWKDKYCYDCVRWESDPTWQGVLEKNTSLFVYNDFLKDVIARWKFRGDYALASVFQPLITKKLKSISFDVLIPIPLSAERLYERGFNQAEALVSGLTIRNVLKRTHSEKQSKKSRAERMEYAPIFHLVSKESIASKCILLIDDIYTTGATLHYAAKLLRDHGAKSVSSLTLARG